MQSLFDLIKGREQVKTLNERAEMIKYFQDKLRDKKGKPFTARFIAIKLGGIPTQELYALRSIALDAERRGGSFGKTFWWAINPNNINKK